MKERQNKPDKENTPPDAAENKNLWAPWRMEYIDALSEPSDSAECFLCRYRDEPSADAKNHVLWRSDGAMCVLNRFPYTGGHGLIAPLEHVGDLEGIADEAMLDMMRMVRDYSSALRRAIGAEGFNVGINVGRCAGAGLPGHLHIHVVPRWGGDTNFMSVLADVRVIPQHLDKIYERIMDAAAELGISYTRT